MAEVVKIKTRGAPASLKLPEFNITFPARNEETDFIYEFRQRAWQEYNKMNIPGVTEEAWRRTDLRHLPVNTLNLSSPTGADQKRIDKFLKQVKTEEISGYLLMEDGLAFSHLDPVWDQKGVVFTDWRRAAKSIPEIIARILGKTVDPSEGKFAALAAAICQNGSILYIPRGVHIDKPLVHLVQTLGNGRINTSHLLIYMDEGSEAIVVNEYTSAELDDGSSLQAGIVEIIAGQDSNLKFVELQNLDKKAWNFSHERARVGRNATLDWTVGSVGGRLSKNFINLELDGQGSSAKMSGFYFLDEDQHLDLDTQQNHNAPNSVSDLLYKGALLGKSRSVWQGMIYVAPNASKSDGYQANRNLVLCKDARADSIPGLEILTDDVRCTHGATVGRLDENEVFYLLSRGIPRLEAQKLIVEGFFDPIMQRIPVAQIRQQFMDVMTIKMRSLC